jgi:hypothetical protein
MPAPFQPMRSTRALSATRTPVVTSPGRVAFCWSEDIDAAFGEPKCTFEKRSVAKGLQSGLQWGVLLKCWNLANDLEAAAGAQLNGLAIRLGE